MDDISFLPVVVASVAAFVASTAWYLGFGRALAALHPAYTPDNQRPVALTPVVELVRNGVQATVVAALVGGLDLTTAAAGVGLGILLWIGFSLMLLSGSVYHERVPWRLAAIHAGDALLHMLIITTIIAAWR